MRRVDGGGHFRRCGIGQRRQQLLYRGGEVGDAGEADDGQRTVGLVHGGARLGQAVAGGIRRMGGQTKRGAFQRKVDFAPDPGQRTDVEIGAHELLFTMPWPMCFVRP